MSAPLPAAAAPDAAELSRPVAARVWRAAQSFEAMALNQLLTPMFATVDTSNGLFGGGSGEDAWKPFLIEAIAKRMTARGGIGLAVPVYHQMLHMQESREEARHAK